MTLPKTRAEAIALGLTEYRTGKPCPKGHYPTRRINSRGCRECDSLKELERSRKRRSNPETRAREFERLRLAAAANRRDPIKNEVIKKWRRENAKKRRCEDRALAEKQNRKCREYRASTPHLREKRNSLVLEWSKNNPIQAKAISTRRRGRKKNAEGTHCAEDIEAIRIRQNDLCAVCAVSTKDEYQVDHIMPLALGGSNWPSNLQILCPTCNQRKGAKHPDDFAKMIANDITFNGVTA